MNVPQARAKVPTMASEGRDTFDPILEAFARAPVGEPLAPEQRAELDQLVADVAAGNIKLIPHAEVHAWVMANAQEDVEFAAE